MRSATLVGDPLQSIYRFRQADVGLFLHMQRHGLGDFPLNCLFLRHNYRSQRHLVEWINTCFSSNTDAMPNPIPHYPAHPTKPSYDSGLHFHYCGDDQCQNQTLGKLITSIRLKDPDASIGLLVRARSQLKNIIPYLENQSIAYRAVGIRSLAQSAFMYDCINLVLLGQNILNHTYWVALFRSPFCRLSWDDITRLCQTNQPLWQTLQSLPHTISSAGKTVLLRVIPILAHHFKQFGRHSPGKITHQTWHTLGGPYTLDKIEDYDLVEDFFRDVDQLAADHPAHLTQTMLERLLHDTSLTDQPQSVNPIEIMTVHKSKGLEFDYILCPSLHYSGAAMSKPLLDWMYTTATSTPEILMHSPPKIQSHANSIHHYLRQHEQQCNQQEQVRLMYVALTRAKKSLHLLTPSTAEKKPSSQSWQSMLEPMLANPCHGLQIHQYDLQDKPAHSMDLATPSVKTTLALPADWQHPIFEAPTIQEEVADSPTKQAIITPLSQHQERLWGETVHRFLQLVSQKGLSHIPSMQHTLYALAHSYGVSARLEEKKLNWVFSKLCDMALDPQARWIFSPDHTEKMVEQTLFTPHTHRLSHTVRLDFSFISQGCRWIIDFKTSGILSESDKLTHTQDYYIEQYQPQLNQYQRFFSDFTPDIPVKLGLYFPLQRTWIPLD